MKRIYLLVIILFSLIAINASAEYLYNIDWNFGHFGFGMDYSSDNDDSIELNASMFNLIIEHKNTNIGFEFNPLKYWAFYRFQNKSEIKDDGYKTSFINTGFYWDLIKNTNILLGPFVSINYLFISSSSGLNKNDCIFTSGLRFSYKIDESIFSMNNNDYQLFGSEIGYRNIFGEHKFYFSINIDMLVLIYSICYYGFYMTHENNYKAGH
jgi:hypothetical protein